MINQTFPWFEWIIVDDGSTNTMDVETLLSFASQDSRIKYFRKSNGGIASARNLAIKHSTTDYIVPLDADDLISPVYLEINYWALQMHPDAGWSYTDSYGFGDQNYLWKKHFSSKTMRTNNILTCTAMIHKSALIDVGCYSELGKNFNEDWHTWLKLLAVGQYPLHLLGYHFGYRRTKQGTLNYIRTNPEEKKRSKREIKKVARNVCRNISAIEYPVASKVNRFISPTVIDWHLTKEASRPYMLLVLPWMEVGGADAFNLTFARHAMSCFNIVIVTTVYAENIWRQKFEQICDEIYCLPEFLEVENYAGFISYLIKSRQIKLILVSNSYYGYYMIPWIKLHFPYICIVDYVHMEEQYWRNGGYARNSAVFDSFLDHTFVCNSATETVMLQDYNKDPNKISVQYIGVDTDYYNPEHIKKGQIRDQYHLGSKKLILFPCRIDPQKRPLLMVEIVKEIKKRIHNIVVLVAGSGPEKDVLVRVIKENKLENNIILVGLQKDLRPFYQDCDLTLICSLKEGLALTAYESMAMGTPVVSSDVGGQRDLIDDSVGYLIHTDQSEKELNTHSYSLSEIKEYANKICFLLENEELYKRKRDNCRVRIKRTFNQKQLLFDFTNRLSDFIEDISYVPSDSLQKYAFYIADTLTVYNEVENYINSYNYNVNQSQKQELMRIVNSAWGKKVIQLILKLRINKLFF